MLYIWPFIAFFSLPLLIPSILYLPRSLSKFVNSIASVSPRRNYPQGVSVILALAGTCLTGTGFWLVYLWQTVCASFLVVKYNTIIHPFTLADNRHYMFYVFRYTIRKAGWIRYVLILPYTISRWLAWDTLGGWYESMSAGDSEIQDQQSFINHPLTIVIDDKKTGKAAAIEAKAPDARESLEARESAASKAVPVSTSLVFLLATSLSLITAPLVEPRYFIIPWVMWRLMVPAWQLPTSGIVDYVPGLKQIAIYANGYDVRLVLETVWFITIHALTGYIFLFKGYVWRAEDGTILEGGQLQRFMW